MNDRAQDSMASQARQDATIPQRDEVLTKLRAFLHERGAAYGLEALGCFGSVARSEATASSDVDVVFRASPAAKLTLFDLALLQEELALLLGHRVDIVELRQGMSARLRERLEREASYA